MNSWRSVSHTARTLSITEAAVYLYVKREGIPTRRAGGRLLVRLGDMQGIRVPLRVAVRLAKELSSVPQVS